MYYNRRLTENFARLIEQNGPLRWLFDYVKNNNELDFLIGKNKQKEWISVYRGLSRILTILPCRRPDKIKTDAADAYKCLAKNRRIDIYGTREIPYLSRDQLGALVESVKNDTKFIRYYQNRKEGYYQNILSRRYGICGTPDDEFVIIDKEAVIGYKSEEEKKKEYDLFRDRYKNLLKIISAKDPQRYGNNLSEKPIGNEVDFLALDKNGNLLIIEYKHGTKASGIYLSPLQIGLYYDLFTDFHNKIEFLHKTVFSMLEQKQKIGLVNPAWPKPSGIKCLIPVLIISEFNKNSVAEDKFKEVIGIVRKETNNREFLGNLKIYNYTTESGLVGLKW